MDIENWIKLDPDVMNKWRELGLVSDTTTKEGMLLIKGDPDAETPSGIIVVKSCKD